jgi:hypothetical protein
MMNNKDHIEIIHVWLFAVTMAVLFMWASNEDYKDAVRGQADYCQAVAQWEADAQAGVGPHDRKGHPDFERLEC